MEKSIDWRQLCAMARRILQADSTIDNHEWSERIKDRIAHERRPYPRPHAITSAMHAVSRAVYRPV